MTVCVEWPDTHELRALPTLFASREVAVRWIRDAVAREMDYGPDLDWRKTGPLTWTQDPDGVYTFRRAVHTARRDPATVRATLPDGATTLVQHGYTIGAWATGARVLTVYVSEYNPVIVTDETPYPESWK
jgi:hypothetical protein